MMVAGLPVIAPVYAVLTIGSAVTPALAFDNSGALWVAGYDSHKLLKFTSNQLTSTGSPAPAVSVSNNVNTIYLTNSLVFSPSATNLPTP